MPEAPSPQFPNWQEIRDYVYERELNRGFAMFVIVSKPDGWNWGYLVFGAKGTVLTGKVSSEWSLFDAVDSANRYLGL